MSVYYLQQHLHKQASQLPDVSQSLDGSMSRPTRRHTVSGRHYEEPLAMGTFTGIHPPVQRSVSANVDTRRMTSTPEEEEKISQTPPGMQQPIVDLNTLDTRNFDHVSQEMQ